MRIAIQSFGKVVFPSRCPCGGLEQDDAFLCEHTELNHKVLCCYESTCERHIDPPVNCPLRKAPVAMIVEGVRP